MGALLTFGVTHFTHEMTTPDNEWIVSVRNLTVQEGIDKDEARQFLETEYLTLFKQLPGFNAMVGVPERGVQQGDFVLIYMFDSKWTRDHYFPGEGELSEEIQEIIEKPEFTQFLGKYFTQEGYDNYRDYLMFARAK